MKKDYLIRMRRQALIASFFFTVLSLSGCATVFQKSLNTEIQDLRRQITLLQSQVQQKDEQISSLQSSLYDKSKEQASQNQNKEKERLVTYPQESLDKEVKERAKLAERIDVSEIAPEFKLSSLNGKNVALSDFKGKPVILFIWATWCPHCVRELGHLEKSYNDIKKIGVELLAIDSGEPKERVVRYLNNRKIEFPVLLDTDSRVSYAYNVIGIPTLVLVDAQGKIKFQGNSLPEDFIQILTQQ